MIERRCSLQDLHTFACMLIDWLPHDCVILLRGDLASGKTTLLSAILEALDAKDQVSSPTFGIQHIYQTPRGEVFHYDLYRKSLQECLMLGCLEMFDHMGWHWVEWGDEALEKILRQSGFKVVIITISKDGDERMYRVEQ